MRWQILASHYCRDFDEFRGAGCRKLMLSQLMLADSWGRVPGLLAASQANALKPPENTAGISLGVRRGRIPLHWLGLGDLAEQAHGNTGAAGRGFLGGESVGRFGPGKTF
jgi:hypothetical protein